MTGGFHEDGLADTADGLGGAVNRERALAIMKDSRIGSYGAVALVLALLCKVALIALLVQAGGLLLASAALFAAHVSSRLMPLLIIRTLPHVGDTPTSKSKPLAESITTAGLLADLEHKVADDRIAVARLDRAGAKLVGAVSQHATRHLEKLHDLVVHARADLTGQILLEALGGADRRAIGKPALHPDRRQDHEQQGANDDELQPHTALTRWGGLGHGAGPGRGRRWRRVATATRRRVIAVESCGVPIFCN